MMSDTAAGVKVFLHAFCGKRQVQPHYEYEEDGDEFYCEVRRRGANRKSLFAILIACIPPSCGFQGLISWVAEKPRARKMLRGRQLRCFAISSLRTGLWIGKSYRLGVVASTPTLEPHQGVLSPC